MPNVEIPRSQGEEFFNVIRRRWGFVVAATVIGMGLAFALSASQPKVYSASATLLFRDAQLDQKFFGATVLPGNTDPQRAAATNIGLVSLDAVAERTSRALDGRMSASKISAAVDVRQKGQADLALVTASDEDPRVAVRLADTFAAEYISFRQEADRAKVRATRDLVRRQLAAMSPTVRRSVEGRTLQSRAEELGILESLQTGNAELVQRAVLPTDPSSPRTARNTVLGFVLGLMAGIAIAMVVERLDRRVRDSEELEALYGRPVLASVEQVSELAAQGAGLQSLPAGAAESFRMLWARLRYFNVDRSIKTILVTSNAAGEGKTTSAWNLAATAAQRGTERVLLMEADLRRPTVASRSGLAVAPGLADVITDIASLDEGLQSYEFSVEPGGEPRRFDVLVAGAMPPNPAELIESQKMEDLLTRLSAEYDLVVIDSPPAAIVADAIPLMRRVDGVVVVVRVGTSNRVGARRFAQELDRLGAPVLGVIANRVKRAREDRYYGGYTYTGGVTHDGGDVADRGAERVGA